MNAEFQYTVQPHGVEPPRVKVRASRLEAAIDLAEHNRPRWVTFERTTHQQANNDARTLRTMGCESVVRGATVWVRAR